MIERTRYVDNCIGKVGAITVVYDKGHFGIGVSICRTDLDRFVKSTGKNLSRERAIANLKESKILLKDLRSVNGLNISLTALGVKMPTMTRGDLWVFEYTLTKLVNDMIYTLALTKVKDETV